MVLSIAFMNFYSVCLHTQVIPEEVSFKDFLVSTGTMLAVKYFTE